MNFLAKSIKSLGNLPVDVSVPVCMFLPPGGGAGNKFGCDLYFSI